MERRNGRPHKKQMPVYKIRNLGPFLVFRFTTGLKSFTHASVSIFPLCTPVATIVNNF